ncbi:MAG: DUF5667 domain-containing protein [Patescibacteria group bacterium]
MIRAIKSAFFVVLLLPILALGRSAYPSLLPSNPFYFTKESMRGLRRAFTFNYINKADLELRIADEKLSEIQKLIDLDIKDSNYLKNAITNYQNNLQVLETHLLSVKETNPAILNPLLDKLVDWYIRHALAFSQFSNGNNEVRDMITKVLASSFDNLQTTDDFRRRVNDILMTNSDPTNELRVVEVISDLEKYMISKDLWTGWFGLKEDLLIIFANRVNKNEVSFRTLENLPNNELVRLKIFDEARGKVSDTNLKSQISVLRQQLLNKYDFLGIIESSAVASEISNIQRMVSGIDAKNIGNLLDQIKYSLTQAQKSFASGNYGVAFSHSSLANALIGGLLWDLSLSAEGRMAEVMILKREYDRMPKQSSNLVIEGKIIALSELVKDRPQDSRIIPAIRDIKFMLAQMR